MRDAAIGIVTDPEIPGRILWVKRCDLPIWVLPGGGIDPGETPEEAVIREVLEETGLIVDITKKTALYLPTSRLASRTHLFMCHVRSGKLKKSEETEELGFFEVDHQPVPAFPLHSDWLKDSLQPSTGPIERTMSTLTWGRITKFFIKHPLISVKYLFLRLYQLI